MSNIFGKQNIDGEQFATECAAALVNFGIRAVGVLVLLVLAWLAAGTARRLLRKTLIAREVDETLVKFISNVLRWTILLSGGVVCLSVFDIQTTSFAAVLGAIGLAIGLAFQGALGNLASGMLLLVFRPFKVGGTVNIAGQAGVVDEIGLMGTTLDTFDNRRVVVPNGKVFGDVIANVTHHDFRRADVEVRVGYSADLDEVRGILERAVQSVPGQHAEREPAVILLKFGASSIDWSVRAWAPLSDFGAVKQATLQAIKRELDGAGIAIPFQQVEVHLPRSDGRAS